MKIGNRKKRNNISESRHHITAIIAGEKIMYFVDKDCSNCGSPGQKIELNNIGKRSKFNVEKSYIKVDPRG
ncbi:MAG: hypothetical protein ACREBU_21300 [Nitrososphaera sp.]